MENEIKELIYAHLIDGADREVSDPTLKEWLSESEDNQKIFRQYKLIWEESKKFSPSELYDSNVAWDKVNSKIVRADGKKRRSRILILFSSAAAIFLILLFFNYAGYFANRFTGSIKASVEPGNRAEITLPDCTIVKLNSGSDITYSYNIFQRARNVNFQGEGYFDVSKGKSPFIIRMKDGLSVIVHGTSFNLQAYEDENSVKASLVEGEIEIQHNDKSLILEPGEIGEFDRKTNVLNYSEGNASLAGSWIDNKIYLDNMSLSSLCRYLEREYKVSISIEENIGDSLRYNGVIDDKSLDDVLTIISRLSDINYSITTDRNIIIKQH